MANWVIVLAGMMMVIMTTVSFYLITVYTPTFGKTVLKLTAADSLIVTICVGISNFIWLPIMGALSDRIGRRPDPHRLFDFGNSKLHIPRFPVGPRKPDVPEDDDGSTLVVFHLCQLQRRDDCRLDRSHAI